MKTKLKEFRDLAHPGVNASVSYLCLRRAILHCHILPAQPFRKESSSAYGWDRMMSF